MWWSNHMFNHKIHTFKGKLYILSVSRLTSTLASLISQYGIKSGPKDKAHILKHSLRNNKFKLGHTQMRLILIFIHLLLFFL